MLMVRLEGPSLIKERSSSPSDQDPPITQPSHLIGPLGSTILPTILLTSQGLPSCFGSVYSHDPHRLPLYPGCCYCSSFIILVRRPTSSPIFHLTPICLTHSHSFCLPIFLTMLSSFCSPFLTTSSLYY